MKKELLVEDFNLVELDSFEVSNVEGGGIGKDIGKWIGRAIGHLVNTVESAADLYKKNVGNLDPSL